MDMETIINGLAHELWAIAQGQAPIEDVVDLMMSELDSFAAAVRADERTACAAVCDDVAVEHHRVHDPRAENVADDCYSRILARGAS